MLQRSVDDSLPVRVLEPLMQVMSTGLQLSQDAVGGLLNGSQRVGHVLFRGAPRLANGIKRRQPRLQQADAPLEGLEPFQARNLLLALLQGIVVCRPQSLDALTRSRLLLLVLLAELGEEDGLRLLLLGLELFDESHLLVDLDEEILDVAVDVEDVTGDLGLDVLRAVGVP